MKFLVSVLFLFLFKFSDAQNENFELVQDVYKQWRKFSFNDRNQCKTIYINDSLGTLSINCIKERLSEFKKFYNLDNERHKMDSIEFDDTELKYIIEQGNKLNDNHWSENIFPNAQIIHPAQFEKHFGSIAFLDPIDKLCYNVYTFSNPIFLRNNTICLFYTEEKTFSNLYGEFNLYVLKNKKWVLYYTFCKVRQVNYGDGKKPND